MSTPHQIVDEVAHAFNSTTERKYWRAYVGGSRLNPVVLFKSRASMVELTFYPDSGIIAAGFNKVSCSFGDYMIGLHRAVSGVLLALKASGHQVNAPIDDKDGRLRIEYDPTTRQSYVTIARTSDLWIEYGTENIFKAREPVL